MPNVKIYKVKWTDNALTDLDVIIEYIAVDSVKIALKNLRKIKSATANLKKFPKRERIVQELKKYGFCSYHEIVLQPWRIIYKITNTNIFILAVIDSRRNIEDILFDRFINEF